MIAQELLRRQRELDPREDLTPYANRWVLLRRGRVLASGANLARLMAGRVCGPLDAVLWVGDPDIKIRL